MTGGAEATLTPLAKAAFAAMEATSPTGISRPFDARRDGFVMGEGAGVLVLESEELATARGATVLGEVLGYASTADAHHLTAPEPTGRPASLAITRAMADAGVTPEGIHYINAHGTSTPLNDRSETEAIKLALGERAYDIPVSSTKSAIGHLLGAAGAVEAIATVLALNARVAPPTLNYEEQDEGLDLDYVPDGPRPLAQRKRKRPPRGPSRSRTRSGSAATTPCCASEVRHERHARTTHLTRGAPLDPFERLETLCDPGTLELIRSEVISGAMGDKARAGDGVVAGAGEIDGRPVFCYAQDSSYAGGSLGEQHANTIVRVLELADKARAPGRRVRVLGRRADAGGRRRARRIWPDLPPDREAVRPRSAGLDHHRPVRRRRRVLAGAD